mmetsp:Transcript_30605/g.67028  ORF Transcript_30605/g.67028 Transcript_30605/m.67028 type:complete len:201 (+) Transcript_30605:510-1112(+)
MRSASAASTTWPRHCRATWPPVLFRMTRNSAILGRRLPRVLDGRPTHRRLGLAQPRRSPSELALRQLRALQGRTTHRKQVLARSRSQREPLSRQRRSMEQIPTYRREEAMASRRISTNPRSLRLKPAISTRGKRPCPGERLLRAGERRIRCGLRHLNPILPAAGWIPPLAAAVSARSLRTATGFRLRRLLESSRSRELLH